jgi:glc operon protein GlcG
MRVALRVVLLALAAMAAAPSTAQQTNLPYGAPITLDQAKKVMAAAENEAMRNNWAVMITIIDSGGHIVLAQRMDNTQLASIPTAEGKAQTALAFKLPSKALEEAVTAGGAGLRLLAAKDVTPIEGGLPIITDGKIIGAIGVSGVLSAQNTQIARAGIEGLAR